MENSKTLRARPVLRGAMETGCRHWTPISLSAVERHATDPELTNDEHSIPGATDNSAVAVTASAEAKR